MTERDSHGFPLYNAFDHYQIERGRKPKKNKPKQTKEEYTQDEEPPDEENLIADTMRLHEEAKRRRQAEEGLTNEQEGNNE